MRLIKATVMLAMSAACQLSFAFTVPQAYQVTKSLSVNSAIFDPVTHTILATIPSSAGFGIGNSVTELSISGDILRSTYIGSEPFAIALSNDGSTAYVGMNGASLVRSYEVATATAGRQLALQGSPREGAQHAFGIAISPSDNNTVAVLSRDSCCANPGHVMLFRDGVLAPQLVNDYDEFVGTMAFGADNTLYGYNSVSSGFELYSYKVDANGSSLQSTVKPAFGQYNIVIQYDNGLLLSSSGQVFDPAIGRVVGVYDSPIGSLRAVAPDSANGITYGIDGSGQLTAFDQHTFEPIASFSTGLNPAYISKLINLGDGNLALIASEQGTGNSLFILQAVPEPSSALLFGIGLMAAALLARHKRP
jgi:outer membrane protein assembly factor BamB